jgi:hypothetical protein
MSRQLRTPNSNEGEKEVGVIAKTSQRISIPNYGVTHLTTALTAGDWVLDAPTEGCHKYLYNTIATTGIVVRGSTAATVTFTDAGATQIKFDGAGEKVVHLIGRSATKWLVASALSAAQSTAIVIGTS